MRTLLGFVVGLVVGAIVASPVGERSAWASGGFQLDEHSAAGVGMAGAQTAIADDPSAIYYNPAGLGFQPGFGAQVGGNLIIARTHVSPDGVTLWHTVFAPTLFVAQRIGNHVAFGIGLFSNFGEHFEFPPEWRGRFAGYMVDVTTATFQPTLALRPLSWLSIGVGLDVVPASLELFRALNFGGGEGNVHVGADAVGIGGNFGLLLELVPRRLNFGFSYRSRMDLDFTGHGSISAPPELRAVTGGRQIARTTVPLPHNFSIATGLFFGHLTLDAELKVSIWRDVQQLQLTLTDPAAPAGTMPSVDFVVLDLHNTWALRAGAQYGFSRDRVRVRLGAGWDTSPVPSSTLGPLLPDTDRVLVSAGIGVRYRMFTVDVGYLAVFLLKKTATNPDLIATYQTFGQVISGSVTLRFEHLLQRAAP
jgi:long-chain fatty acid transport protein